MSIEKLKKELEAHGHKVVKNHLTGEELEAVERELDETVGIDEEDFGKAIENGNFQPKGFLDETSMCYVLDAGQNCKTLKPFERKYFE